MIEVRISKHELDAAGRAHDRATPRESEKYILHRLKRAGIPVTGIAFFLGIERGTLLVKRESDTGGWVFKWWDH